MNSNDDVMPILFTKESTNVAKGVAIGIMLFHHLFYRSDSWDLFWHKFYIGSTPLISYIATHGKVCVTIFVLLSAYGLTYSYTSKSVTQAKRLNRGGIKLS